MNQQLIKRPISIVLPRPEGLYQFHTVDTAEIETELRYEFLTTNCKPYTTDIAHNRRTGDRKTDQRATDNPQGSFSLVQGGSSDTVFNPYKPNSESLFISLLLQGTIELTGRTPLQTKVLTAGSLALYERDRPLHYNSGHVKQLFLILPYAYARAALGGGLDELALSLDDQPLSPFIRSQMMLLDAHAAHLSTKAISSILDGLYNVSLLMLADIGRERGNRIEGSKNFIFSAAKRYIEQHYAQVNLSPDAIAVALRCSRSGLDRAFLEQHTSVMRVLQEVRLKSARYRLENYAEERIDTIAYLCGFSSPSIFSKLFKLRFGMSPKAWRQAFINSYSFQPAEKNNICG
ncbi:helix-turn-helix domain-containing protein [Erwiniaceae bacterium CAU 1747]